MIFFPNGKINLGLNILRKRPDGFHDIETAMVPVCSLYDVLETVRREEGTVDFGRSGLALDCPADQDLCLKAYKLMKEQYGVGGIAVHLRKCIPFGAGLGGGSADAAFMVKALNQLYGLGLCETEMTKICARLGSDTAFFITNRPALATGRGEILNELTLNLSGYSVLLVKPALHISTAEAYSGVTPRIPEHTVAEIISEDMSTWKNRLKNDFETSLFPRYPQLKKIKERLYGLGAVYASLSGSGSTVFGLFKGGDIPETTWGNHFVHTHSFE